MSVTIKEVSDDKELRELAELASEIWHEFFPGIITSEQVDYMVEKFQSYPAMRSQISSQGYSYSAVYEDGEMCGYFAVKPEEERIFLSKLYLRSDKRGRGTASLMMKSIVEKGKIAGKKSVYLTVNKHNDHAIAVYKKMGFTVIDEPVTDIGNGFVMDDFVMELVI